MDWQIHGMSGNGDVAMGPEMFVIIAAIVILLQLRTRRIRPRSIWILPVFLAIVTAATISFEYSGISRLLLSAAGLVIGCAIGAIIGSRMEVTFDEQGRIMLKGSLVAVTIWILVLGLKFFGKGIIGDMGLISLDDLTAALLTLTLGSIMARRTYVLLKYLRLKKSTEAIKVTPVTGK
jgi:membrane protein CcdC involved in cytochrome C biogenesis